MPGFGSSWSSSPRDSVQPSQSVAKLHVGANSGSYLIVVTFIGLGIHNNPQLDPKIVQIELRHNFRNTKVLESWPAPNEGWTL